MNISTKLNRKKQSHRGNAKHYQTKSWKQKVNAVWLRDKHLCQHCLEKGIIHPLTKGTKDRSIQGTVDHIVPLLMGGSDELENLRLIGTIHHDVKSAKEKRS